MYAIVFPTALEYWLRSPGNIDGVINDDKLLQSGKIIEKDILLHEISDIQPGLAKPIHVSAPNDLRKWSDCDVNYHRYRLTLPNKSYISLEKDICISSPESCFLQAALYCNLAELVVIANELCSGYCIDPGQPAGQKFRQQITSKQKIKQYLKTAEGAYGIKKAKQAIQYSLDNSFSYIESRMAAICVLPFFLGGFGIEAPVLNDKINLSTEGTQFLGRDFCTCDFVWREKRVVMEYDSNLTHLEKSQHYYDKKKATALTMSGYHVVSATAEHLGSFINFEKLFLALRNQLGLKMQKERMYKYRELRWQTYKQLFKKTNPDIGL